MNPNDLAEDSRAVIAAAAQVAARRGYVDADHSMYVLRLLVLAEHEVIHAALFPPTDPDPKDRDDLPESRPNNVISFELAQMRRAA